MNERIKELAEQAKAESSQWLGSKPATTMTYDELEKFAELIVEECRNVVTELYRKSPLEVCGYLITADEEIAKHFYGAEE